MEARENDSQLVFDVPPELFAAAESSSFGGVYAFDELSIGPDTYRAKAPFEWSAMVSNVGGALLVGGTVRGTMETECVRCLDAMDVFVEGEIEGFFIIPGQGEEPDDMDEDEFDILPDTNQIDLEPLIRAAIIVDLPLVPLCDEACKGLCSMCGANLNEGPCSCKPSVDEEPAFAPNNPFAALANYSFDEEE